MNRALVSIGIAAAVVCGSATPALAAVNPIDAKITYISSGSSQVSSPVKVKGTWSTKKLEAGQTFKVTSDVINWAYDFPFTLNDDTKIGACDNDCNGGHYEDAKPENSKWGWVNPDGTTSWMITWIAEPGVKYSIHDGYTKLSTSVKCAKGDTWDPNTTVYVSAIQVNDYTIEFTAPEGVKTCVTYTPEPMATPAGAKTATNVAYVNSTKLERTIEVSVNGGTTGDGTTPTPSPSVSTPAPNPTTTTPVPVPSVSTPAPQSGTSTPSAKPSHSGMATPSTRPTVKAETPKPSETKLAKTGSDSSFIVVLVPLVAIIGTFIYLISLSRKDDN